MIGSDSGDEHLSNFVFAGTGNDMLLRLPLADDFCVVMPGRVVADRNDVGRQILIPYIRFFYGYKDR